MILVNEAQTLLLKELLENRYLIVDEVGSGDAGDLLEQIESELRFIERKKIPALTTEQIADIQARLLDVVVNDKPKSLMEGHGEDWFFVNGRGHTVWNFRNATRPALEVVREMGLLEASQNSDGNPLYDITQAVKRHRLVKPIKARAK